jgi:hypothetical protein
MELNSTVATELAFALLGAIVVIVLASSAPSTGASTGNRYLLITVSDLSEELPEDRKPHLAGVSAAKSWEGGLQNYSKTDRSMIFFSNSPSARPEQVENLPENGQIHILD